jgi:hypothetical protein
VPIFSLPNDLNIIPNNRTSNYLNYFHQLKNIFHLKSIHYSTQFCSRDPLPCVYKLVFWIRVSLHQIFSTHFFLQWFYIFYYFLFPHWGLPSSRLLYFIHHFFQFLILMLHLLNNSSAIKIISPEKQNPLPSFLSL